jgi:MerR family transcriptional regulator, light-induced transcriptional regulator
MSLGQTDCWEIRNVLYRYHISAATNPELSTAQLAARTGMPAGTLRMWESRYGFPTPARLPGGHRRYSEQDVTAVLEVLRLREQGLSLTAAIERARRQEERTTVASVFSGLRQRHPEVAPEILSKRVVLELTHAIEDEFCARAAHGLLIASFQREHFYRASQRRWVELTRTASVAIVLADFEKVAEPPNAPIEVPIDVSHPLSREWTLVIDAPGARACLAAWEQPSQTELPDGERRFEVLWSFAPEVVRSATEVAAELLWRLAPDVARRLPDVDRGTVGDGSELYFANALSQRMISYLGALLDRRQRPLGSAVVGGPHPMS